MTQSDSRLLRAGALLALLALAGCGALSGLTSKSETAQTLNEFRIANGRAPLQTDANLIALAQAHALDMARRDTLDHAGFMERRGPRGARAENVAYGCTDSACTIRMWVNSSGHRTNMLRPDVTKYGLASAKSASGKTYWTLMVGE
jgi:uncharacterized protein YkwD